MRRTGQISGPRSTGFIRRFTQFIGRFVTFGRSPSLTPAGSSGRPSRVDPAEMAVAPLVHDLKNQLILISGCADNLAEVVTGQADQEIADLRQCVDRAMRLTREILAAANEPSGVRRPVDLNQVVVSIAEMISAVAADRVLVRLRLSPMPVPVVAELRELERIVLNLALNACDAITGEGLLTIETAVVRPQEHRRFGRFSSRPTIRLTVTDTGHGMTPDVTARIFEPFFSTRETGTGVGLSSVAFTVRQLHGTMVAESHLGRGTSIIVTLPLAPASGP